MALVMCTWKLHEDKRTTEQTDGGAASKGSGMARKVGASYGWRLDISDTAPDGQSGADAGRGK